MTIPDQEKKTHPDDLFGEEYPIEGGPGTYPPFNN
jgi:hypothetical protein